IYRVADTRHFDELTDWLDALPEWDRTPRLDNWLRNYCGANPEQHPPGYLELISRKFIMQVLYRGLNPGSKADYALVLCGAQGTFKDLALWTTFKPYLNEGLPSPRRGAADFALALAGCLVAHEAEMAAWSKSDVEDQKAIMTRRIDRGRRAYGYETRD